MIKKIALILGLSSCLIASDITFERHRTTPNDLDGIIIGDEDDVVVYMHNCHISSLNFSIDEDGESLTDIKFIGHVPLLTKLSLRGNYLLRDNYRTVSCLIHIQQLDLTGINLQSLEPLSHLRLLTCLNLENNQMQSIEPLTHLRQLYILSLYDCHHICDIECLVRMRELGVLNIGGVFSNDNVDYPPVDFLHALTNLHTLDISSNPYISNMSVLSVLPYLGVLNMKKCNSVTDYSFLSRIRGLRQLTIEKDKDIPSLNDDVSIFH